ncbi:MAG: hypothetical protein ABII22_02645 [Candidatus Micrarchaeota archaeon]
MGGMKYCIVGIVLLITAFMTIEYLKDLLDIFIKTLFGFVVIVVFLLGLLMVFAGLDEDSKYQKKKAGERAMENELAGKKKPAKSKVRKKAGKKRKK